MTRLNKFDVEAMLNGYDANPVAALTSALAKVLDRPGADWGSLVAAAPFDDSRRALLLAGDQAALDRLVADLNELRTL